MAVRIRTRYCDSSSRSAPWRSRARAPLPRLPTAGVSIALIRLTSSQPLSRIAPRHAHIAGPGWHGRLHLLRRPGEGRDPRLRWRDDRAEGVTVRHAPLPGDIAG